MVPFIHRDIVESIAQSTPPKAVVIYGPRRAGKTTLLSSLLGPNTRILNADRRKDIVMLDDLASAGDVDVFLENYDTIVIDEAQRIPNIGLIIKILVDANRSTKIFVAASSSLELAKGVRESAVGRLINRHLWPLSLHELVNQYGQGYIDNNFERLLVYGMYPEVVTKHENAIELLSDYSMDLMYKDVFELGAIRNPEPLRHLVEYLAYHIGQEVSYENLAREIKVHSLTVEKYIDLLEKCFIIKRCGSYSRNLANELKKGKKIYFCDVGVRNAIIGDFSPFSARADAGALWENFFFIERMKKLDLQRNFARQYFWRVRGTRRVNSTDKPVEYSRSIDFIETRDNILQAFECKLNPTRKDRTGQEFRDAYPDCDIHVVTPRDAVAWLIHNHPKDKMAHPNA